MILKASQRAGGVQLALHLLNDRDNDHVELHELRGFVSDDLIGAFKEIQTISLGTKCRQFMFSLSLSPPERETVPVDAFESAIADIEKRMNLTGQPRAIVFHEKEGRRHAHCVWSRIDASEMKAINLPHYKIKLRDMSRELYLEHGWQMPCGLRNAAERNPLNFTMEQWQQAKRAKQDPRVIKQMFQECWAKSDSAAALGNALKEHGFALARGDRRGHVAVDWRGEVYALARWTGIKTKEVRARLGDGAELPSVDEAKKQFAKQFTEKLRAFASDAQTRHQKKMDALQTKRMALVAKQRQAREKLRQSQSARKNQETRERSAKLHRGLKGLWQRLTGRYRKISAENEAAARECEQRDRAERQEIIERQLRERRTLQADLRQLHQHHEITMQALNRDVGQYLDMAKAEQDQGLDRAQNQPRERQRRRYNR